MNKLFQLISVITIIAANMILAVGLYWYLYPYKTVEFNNLPFPVLVEEVRGGERLTYKVDYCKHTTINPLISRYYKNGILYVVADIVAANNKTGCNNLNVQVDVPQDLPPGKYTMEIVYHYQVNPIREINVVARTESFTIIK